MHGLLCFGFRPVASFFLLTSIVCIDNSLGLTQSMSEFSEYLCEISLHVVTWGIWIVSGNEGRLTTNAKHHPVAIALPSGTLCHPN